MPGLEPRTSPSFKCVFLVKMQYNFRWPSIITTDPSFGNHVHMDTDNDPGMYFVLFLGLGKHHTHAWIKVSDLEIYTRVKRGDKEKKYKRQSKCKVSV